MLTVENLDVSYGDVRALDDVSLEVAQGAIVAIVGANGAGKTTLIRTIAGMHRPTGGRILLRDRNIAGLPVILALKPSVITATKLRPDRIPTRYTLGVGVPHPLKSSATTVSNTRIVVHLLRILF